MKNRHRTLRCLSLSLSASLLALMVFLPSEGAFARPIQTPESLSVSPQDLATRYTAPYHMRFSAGVFSDDDGNLRADFNALVPLKQSARSLSFFHFRGIEFNRDANALNVGMGFRHLHPSRQSVMGVYGVFHRKHTASGVYFSEGIFGMEHKTACSSLIANVYIPFEETHKEDAAAFYGTDVEVGGRLNMPGLHVHNLSLFLAGYYFGASGFKPITGPRLRLEYPLMPTVRDHLALLHHIGLRTSIQYDKVRHLRWTAGLRFVFGFKRTAPFAGAQRHMLGRVRYSPVEYGG